MAIGLLGKKLGMTRVYDGTGKATAVTVIHVGGNSLLQTKTPEKDGYSAVQIGYGDRKASRVTKPMQGHFKKAASEPKCVAKEIRLAATPTSLTSENLKPSQFQQGDFVDVISKSKGRGFQGGVKRHGFQGGPQSHGSMTHRRVGSVAQGSTPGRIWKNTRMPGHMGNTRVTVQNLKVVQTRDEDEVILISGAVPGPNGGYVLLRPAIKKSNPVQEEKR